MTVDKSTARIWVPAARVLRGNGVDAVHCAAVSVVEKDSRGSYALGDPEQEGLLLLAFTEPALGIAIKVLDGNARALGPIAVETLKQLGLIDDLSRHPTLQRHEAPTVTNARKLVTGRVRADFRLQRV